MSEIKGRIAHHVSGETTTIAECLRKHFKLEPPQIDELFGLGAIYLNKDRVMADAPLAKGAYLRLHLQPKRFPITGIDWKSIIVAEERDFLIINKPAGVPVHASLDNLLDNVLHQMRVATGKTLLVTQRLDVPVAGVMLFAKTPEFQRLFNSWLGERKIKKQYRALTELRPKPGLHVHFMEPSERSPKKVSLEESPGWLRCELKLGEKIGEITLGEPPRVFYDVEIDLLTGRTHQIRAQLGSLHCPVMGDRPYGGRKSYRERVKGGEGIALFSERLSFPNYVGTSWEYKVNPPWKKL